MHADSETVRCRCSRVELANAQFEYLEIFHNRQRRDSSLEMHTPIEYEILHQTRQPVAS